MSTRANIAIKNSDDTYRAIYTHFDGYPSHHLPILKEFYNTKDKVNQLLDLGDLSVLAESSEKPEGHSYNNPVKGYCVAYGRDRGEHDTEATIFYGERTLIDRSEDFLYIFENDEWKVIG